MFPVRLKGPVSKYTGYAVGFLSMVKELKKRGEIDIDLKPYRNHVADGTDDVILQMLEEGKNYTDVGVLTCFPVKLRELGTRYKIAYCMYEATDIPFLWKSAVEQADEVWVPSQFCVGVFKRYNPRIRLVRWGVDNVVFRPMPVQKDRSMFRFGTVGVQGKRKGIDVLVNAFNRAFRGNAGVRLTIKTRDTKWLPGFANPMIDVIDENWEEERLVQFYNEIDCLAFPTRAEGIGMTPLQAAMCGTPALVTNWSGCSDYIDNNGIWGINIAGLSRVTGMEVQGAQWAEPDQRHLVQLMQWAVDTRPVVSGDYNLWTTGNMAREFTTACTLAWRRYTNGNSH